MRDYENDPNITAISLPSANVNAIPDIGTKKSSMYGKNPNLQYTDYESHPNIESIRVEEPIKTSEESKSESSPVHNLIMKHLEDRKKAEDYVMSKIGGVVEPVLSAISSGIAAPVGAAFGALNTVINPKFGTQEAIQKGRDVASNIQQALTYQPRSEPGKAVNEAIGNLASSVGPVPELQAFAPLAQPAIGQLKGGIPKVRIEKVGKPLEAPTITPSAINQSALQSAGSAAVAPIAEAKAALADLPEHMQESLANVDPAKLTPTDLKVINNHKKFSQFGMLPTEGEALENQTLMSEEKNDRVNDPNLQARFEERDPKIIQAFNDIKEKVAPDVYENDPVRLAAMPLEKMKADYEAHLQRIKDTYKIANDAAGENSSPIDIGELKNNVEKSLKKEGKTKYLTPELKDDFYENLEKGYLTSEEYENLRTDSATIARTNADPLKRRAAAIFRDQLENVPIKGDFAKYKPLYDAARKEVVDLKTKEKIPAYAAAMADSRTPDEIAANIPHPAANGFMAKHYSSNTPQLDIERMLNIIGRDSPEHQALNKLKIDEFKFNSGIKNDKGTVSQARLNSQIYHQHRANLPTMFGNETTKTLQDLADVANLTEHVKGVHKVNTSNTALIAEENQAKKAAKEFAENAAATVLEHKANAAIPFVGTLTRKYLKGRAEEQALLAEKQAAEAEKQALAELSKRRLSPTAGIRNLSDLGK